jgi:hypothetical protein
MNKLNKINFFISDSPGKEYIYENKITYINNDVSKQAGKIKNKFSRQIVDMDYAAKIYLKNIKKDDNDDTFENFGISKNKEITEDNYKDYIRKHGITMTTKGLILRTVDNCANINTFMETWMEKMNKYDDAMINIYYYGYICKKESDNRYEKISCYILCDKYGDYKDVMKLCLVDSISYLKSYLRFLKILAQGNREVQNETSAICTNLRLYNYGLGRDANDNAIFVLLEFNETSIIFRKSIKNEIGQTKDGNPEPLNKNVGISYIPYYVAEDYLNHTHTHTHDNNNSDEWITRLDKLYAVGLAELILYLFYKKSRIFLDLYLFITNIVELPYMLQYSQIMLRYLKSKEKAVLYKLILNLEIKYNNLDNSFSKYLMHLLLSLLSEKYEDIPYPENIFKNIELIEGKETSYSSIEQLSKDNLIKEIGYVDSILDKKEIDTKIHDIIENAEGLVISN